MFAHPMHPCMYDACYAAHVASGFPSCNWVRRYFEPTSRGIYIQQHNTKHTWGYEMVCWTVQCKNRQVADSERFCLHFCEMTARLRHKILPFSHVTQAHKLIKIYLPYQSATSLFSASFCWFKVGKLSWKLSEFNIHPFGSAIAVVKCVIAPWDFSQSEQMKTSSDFTS